MTAAHAVGLESQLEMYYAEVPHPPDTFSVVHEKTWILDDTVALSGSHNWTRHSARMNHECLTVSFEVDDVTRRRARFRSMWHRRGDQINRLEGAVGRQNLSKDSTGKSSHYGPRNRRERSGSQIRKDNEREALRSRSSDLESVPEASMVTPDASIRRAPSSARNAKKERPLR